jgi:hypothetical protein
MPHQLLRGPLAQSSAFRYDNSAMDSAHAARRTPYPLERRTFIAMLAGGLLAAPLAAQAQRPAI